MKIVHVDDFAHPDAGYEINLLTRLQAKQGHQVIIVAGELEKLPKSLTGFFGLDNLPERDARFERETGVKIVRIPLHAHYSGRALFSRKIYSVLSEIDPDVAFVHGMESLIGMEMTVMSPFLRYPIVLDSHSLEMASVNKLHKLFRGFYKAVIAPIILRRRIPVIRIVDSDYVEKCLGIPLARTTLLSFGTDVDFFQPNPEVRAQFRLEHGISKDAFVILYAGKLDMAKGGQLLADALSTSLPVDREIVFVVVGNTSGGYGAKVEQTFAGSQNRILRFPTQRYFDLARFYQSADLAVFPKQCSVSFFEVQACGLPVLFEVNEINSQRTAYGNAVTFEENSVEDFRKKMTALSEMSAEAIDEIGRQARRYVVDHYNYVPIAQRFSEVMRAASKDRQKTRTKR